MITVGELIALLQQENPKRVVVMSRDEEGNGFMPLHAVETCAFNEDDGDVGIEKLNESLVEAGYTEEDIMTGGKPAILLVPEG